MKKHSHTILSASIFILVLGLWQMSAQFPRFEFLFASPVKILSSLIQNVSNGVLVTDFLITGFEALTGFILGMILGTITGFMLWYSPLVARIFRPYIVILGAVPVFAFAPMIIVWFGIGISMKIAMAALGTFLVALAQAYEGAKSIDIEEFRLLKTFGATRAQIFQKIIFPSALSWVLASMKLNIGFALLGAFIGEFISSNQGLGHFMIRAGALYDIASVFAGGAFLVLLALLFNLMVIGIEKNKMRIIEFLSVDKEIREALRD
ncbi:MAG: ABC transporter permease [Verrucomicrobiota bacterium]